MPHVHTITSAVDAVVNPAHVPVAFTLGALFLGFTVTATLYGLTSFQTFLYYARNQQPDRTPFRSLVAFMWFVDSVHMALSTHALWFYLVANWGNPSALSSPVWSLCAQCVVSAISDVTVRGVFGRRIWILSKFNRSLTMVIVFASAASFVTAIAFVAEACDVGTFEKINAFSWILVGSLICGAIVDIILAGSLVWLLLRLPSGFGNSLVAGLIMYGVNTGILTTVCAILVIVAYIKMPSNFVWLALYMMMSKLNLNSLLAGLNSRDVLRKKRGDVYLQKRISQFGVTSSDGRTSRTAISTFGSIHPNPPNPRVKQVPGGWEVELEPLTPDTPSSAGAIILPYSPDSPKMPQTPNAIHRRAPPAYVWSPSSEDTPLHTILESSRASQEDAKERR